MVRRIACLMVFGIFAASVATFARAEEPKSDFFTASDGVKIHYLTLGEKGSYVVLVHGFTSSAQGNWFRQGIAQEIAKNHRVVAIDSRNHGESDKPNPGSPGRALDVLELMDHLKIEKAHIHGYSMGGSFTQALLTSNPDRFITAGLHGWGVRETDPALVAKAAEMDKELAAKPENKAAEGGTGAAAGGTARRGGARAAAAGGGNAAGAATATAGRGRAGAGARGGAGGGTGARPTLDLTKISFPVLSINGALDNPNSKTTRMQRELKQFTNVIVPARTHMSAVGDPLLKDSLVKFINEHDTK